MTVRFKLKPSGQGVYPGAGRMSDQQRLEVSDLLEGLTSKSNPTSKKLAIKNRFNKRWKWRFRTKLEMTDINLVGDVATIDSSFPPNMTNKILRYFRENYDMVKVLTES